MYENNMSVSQTFFCLFDAQCRHHLLLKPYQQSLILNLKQAPFGVHMLLTLKLITGAFTSVVCGFFVCQWTISELACYTYSMVAVPLYDTLGTEAIAYIIDQGTQKGTFAHEPRVTCSATTVL